MPRGLATEVTKAFGWFQPFLRFYANHRQEPHRKLVATFVSTLLEILESCYARKEGTYITGSVSTLLEILAALKQKLEMLVAILSVSTLLEILEAFLAMMRPAIYTLNVSTLLEILV